MTVAAPLAHWQRAGLTPDEALAGFGLYTGREDVSWEEVRAIAEMHERRLAAETEELAA